MPLRDKILHAYPCATKQEKLDGLWLCIICFVGLSIESILVFPSTSEETAAVSLLSKKNDLIHLLQLPGYARTIEARRQNTLRPIYQLKGHKLPIAFQGEKKLEKISLAKIGKKSPLIAYWFILALKNRFSCFALSQSFFLMSFTFFYAILHLFCELVWKAIIEKWDFKNNGWS